MTTATFERNTRTRIVSIEPEQDVIAWLLWAKSPEDVREHIQPETSRPTAGSQQPSEPVTSESHDMTPELVAWVLGTGYAAGRVPAGLHGASTHVQS